jgi:poly(ADP-ribose) glycohydrolase ARH3
MSGDDRTALADRIRSALLGTAIGDAIGRPFEGRPRVRAADLDAWAVSDAPLTWTDDTAMTLALGEVLADRGPDVDLQQLGDAFRAAYDTEPGRGYGAGPPRVFAAAARGVAYEDAARALFSGAGSFGNGAAMRAAPAGCVHPGDVAAAVALGRRQALVTHAHPIGRDGAGAVAGLVAALLRVQPDEPPVEVVPRAVATVGAEGIEPELEAALLRARCLEDPDPAAIAAALGTGISALETVPAAVACLCAGGGDPERVVRTAVLLGGDTDTIAAIAGALVGAMVSASAWPAAWLARLEQHDRIVSLADRLAALVGA